VPDDIGPAAIATESLTCTTSDGVRLEAEIRRVAEPRGAVVLAHPHPQQGGSMRSLVTSELFRLLPERGLTALRFNFRGVEGSEGSYGEGLDEAHDIVAAIDEISEGRPAGVPLVLAGWSFGADVSLSILDDRLQGWFLIASPLRILPEAALVAAHDPRPKVFAIPENDEFRVPDSVRDYTAAWRNVTIHTIPGAGHYLVGKTGKVAELLVDFVASLA
jgi:alpha/beta superfamily hydrolase